MSILTFGRKCLWKRSLHGQVYVYMALPMPAQCKPIGHWPWRLAAAWSHITSQKGDSRVQYTMSSWSAHGSPKRAWWCHCKGVVKRNSPGRHNLAQLDMMDMHACNSSRRVVEFCLCLQSPFTLKGAIISPWYRTNISSSSSSSRSSSSSNSSSSSSSNNHNHKVSWLYSHSLIVSSPHLPSTTVSSTAASASWPSRAPKNDRLSPSLPLSACCCCWA